MLEYGRGVRQNVKKAFHWYKKAAEQGFVEAQYTLGRMYERGAGIKSYRPNDFQLFNFKETPRRFSINSSLHGGYSLSAFSDPYSPHFGLGQGSIETSNHGYKQSSVIKQDMKKAQKWYEKAAEQGHPHAQVNLGAMYYSQSVEQDYAKAFEWTHKAAERGDGLAQLNLGVMYFNGDGVSQDYVWAYTWISLAKIVGEPTSQNHLDILKKAMTEEQISEAEHKAETWLVKHQMK